MKIRGLKVKLFPFQAKGVLRGCRKLMESPHAFLLCDEQGLGKSVQAIAMALRLRKLGLVKHVLIVTPLSAVYDWLKMLENFTRMSYTFVGSNDIRFRTFFTVMGYDRFRILEDRLVRGKFELLVCDEFHNIKNPNTKRTKALVDFRHTFALMMSGTPILNSTQELWTILNYCDPKSWPSYMGFQHRYCVLDRIRIRTRYGARYIWKPVGPKNVALLRKKLKPLMLRRLKSHVMPELPSKIYQTIGVSLSARQMRVYKKLRDELKAEIEGKEIKVTTALAKFTRLRQICCGLGTLSDKVEDSVKIDTVCGFVRDNLYGRHKFVIVAPFIRIAQEISSRLEEYNNVCVTSRTKEQDAAQSTEQFQTDRKCKLFIGTIRKNKEGKTLTAADTIIFVGKDLVGKINEQMEDRLHRIGQSKSVTVVSIMCEDTVDERIEEMLLAKEREFQQVIEGREKLSLFGIKQLLS